MSFDDVLAAGRGRDGQLVFETGEPARPAVFTAFPGDLDPRVQSALIGAGIAGLYGHQADVWEAAQRGEHVCVSTGTASGKSLAFTLPVLEAVCADKRARAIYIYPTKALAQDQARALRQYGLGLRPAVYDGDTPKEQRHLVRKFANPILTNPDMLHVGILPNHRRWADVLANLTHVVVDEAHTYRGVFGSHVALVLRRLRRVCALYGTHPQFLLASATISNPAEACAALTGLDVRIVDRDGAPRAPRRVAFWDTPLLDEAEGTRGSALGEAAGLLASLTTRGLRTICFVKSRKASELVYRFARESLEAAGRGDVADRLAPYRAGYTAEERRRIEGDLVSGRLLGVVATEALELGVDVGLLDCAIAVGFPGTVASLRQQWGRAGRRGEGLALLVPGADALDRYFINHPDALLGRPNEAAILDPTNPEIRIGHLRAAACELPLVPGDDEVLGAGALAAAEPLVEAGELVRTPGGLAWRGAGSPAGLVSLRSGSLDAIAVVEQPTGALLGMLEQERAFATVHQGAVYLHRGETYHADALDLTDRVALVSRFDGPWYTQPRRDTETSIVEALRAPELRCGVELTYGTVEVSDQVVAYERRSLPEQRLLDTIPLDLPARHFSTRALWFVPPDELLEEAGGDLLGALHGAEHALISVLPLLAMCDRWDIGGLSTNIHPQTLRPTVFVYDGHAGGVGIAQRGYDRFAELVASAARVVLDCRCRDGCPSCVQSPKCGNLNEMLDKGAAGRLLELMTQAAAAQPLRRSA
ncbi:MAG TPA: DEAD/DEAH box helicase [Gaiellales bacterium]|jgi:DEAD/DEAH box helicase domain-containing protein